MNSDDSSLSSSLSNSCPVLGKRCPIQTELAIVLTTILLKAFYKKLGGDGWIAMVRNVVYVTMKCVSRIVPMSIPAEEILGFSIGSE